MTSLNVFVAAVPLTIAAALSYRLRRRSGATHALIWLVGVPVLYLLTTYVALLVLYHGFGVDLAD